MALAQKHVARGRLRLALGVYRDIVAHSPQDARSWLRIGDLCVQTRAKEEACEAFAQAAHSYQSQGFERKAAAAYARLLRIGPQDGHVHLVAGELAVALLDRPAARRHFDAAISVFTEKGLTHEVLDALCRRLELSPDDAGLLTRIAMMYAQAGLKAEAIGNFKKACEQLTHNAKGYICVAAQWLEVDPKNLELRLDLAKRLLVSGDSQSALTILRKSYEDHPQNIQVLALLARALAGTGFEEKAAAIIRYRAQLLFETSRQRTEPDRAPDSLARGSRRHPAVSARESLDSMFNKASTYLHRGLTGRAVPILRVILREQPDHIPAQTALKDALVRRGAVPEALALLVRMAEQAASARDRRRAIDYLREAYGLDPAAPRVRSLLRQLSAQ